MYSRILMLILVAFASCTPSKSPEPSISWSSVPIDEGVAPSVEIDQIIAPYRQKLAKEMGQVIGEATHDLMTNDGKYASTLGTFITKLLYEDAALQLGKAVDLAIMNHHGGLRASLLAGPITIGEIYEIMPFENEMVVLAVDGNTLKNVLNHIAKGARSMALPASFEVKDKKAQNIKINGKPLEASQTYHITTSDYLANGGSGFSMLKGAERLSVTPVKLRDMILNRIKSLHAQQKPVEATISNNVIEL